MCGRVGGVFICIHASLVCVHFDVVFLWLDGWLGACVCMYGCDHTIQMLFVCQWVWFQCRIYHCLVVNMNDSVVHTLTANHS